MYDFLWCVLFFGLIGLPGLALAAAIHMAMDRR